MKHKLLSIFIILISAVMFANGGKDKKQTSTEEFPFRNSSLPMNERIADLISRLTLEEKISQLLYDSEAIPRLDIPYYNWWGECLHGVARFGKATVFPQAIGLAATFDDDLIQRVASAISDEARAKFNAAKKLNNEGRYISLTFWTPNINIFRDARWGRGQETYGEDPFLTSYIGKAFVKGIQGDHPKYLKAASCAKHFVVHSGPEGIRHSFNATPSKKDFYETYLPAFESLVTEANVEGVMCAYNRTYDDPCCGSSFLMQDILRDQWKFDGYIVSDCWAIHDFYNYHKVNKDVVESASRALLAGVNVNCGTSFRSLPEAVENGSVSENDIDNALSQLLKTRFRLGLFDPESEVPFNSISPDVVCSEEHQLLAREAAQKSVVLLKNKNNVLPLDKKSKNLFVLGPNAADVDVLLGNYNGVSENIVTVLEGIFGKIDAGTNMQYRKAFLLERQHDNEAGWVIGEAKYSDAVIVVMGLSPLLEGEEGESISSVNRGDRVDIGLPEHQIAYLKQMRENLEQPIIAVIMGGSPIAMPEVQELADAVLFAWYPGEQGGNGVADILFGDVNPSGRLPLTFPKSVDQLPPFEDYSMKNRTYRYMTDEPLYTFGFGLSFTKFEYSDLVLDKTEINSSGMINCKATITNVGDYDGEEVVQFYIKDVEASVDAPLSSLRGIKRVSINKGESVTVEFTITPAMLYLIDNNGNKILEPGEFKIIIGGSSPGNRSIELGAAKHLEAAFMLSE
ncbi:MAG: glycoside hydrolase family 3 C-terminal domain-containing protein [Melioribacteraceae bacterium]|nr:glycoside hydrolase family 3 C-terminal domain-containing protein [Melioribacteraceae bacterium]MCF8356858.1 glycoside hydrolase family 3 C-terminal domain-containing protein [Melioribacteraceae bacterium]MCF8396237.1 glycoside hydrolase family 3 C-terminal domain-containing protein [Melioribacteraceae bacterium]MCF8421157.1 glycoside hydrolase family 3 C-terminal domain-containing protein [Melioribacteraceae bacterium]